MAYFARAVRAKLLELPNVRMSSIYVLYTFIGFKNCFKFHSHTVSYCFYIRKISFGEKVKHFFCLILRIRDFSSFKTCRKSLKCKRFVYVFQ